MGSKTMSAPPGSIGADLARRRLQHRARRIELAMAALQRLEAGRSGGSRRPPSLGQALAAFAEDLAQVERTLATL